VDLRQLRALLAVGEHRSFSAAARSLHTVQSNISTHVSRLERELGVCLIDRATNSLTEEGLVVAERVRRIETEFSGLESDLAALRDEIRGVVRIGIIGTTARWLVAPLLQWITDRHPAIKVIVLDATTTSLVPQLTRGQLEMSIINLPLSEPDLVVEPLFDEERILVAPASHPLFDRTVVDFQTLSEHRLLLEAVGTTFRDELDAQAASHGVELQAQAEVDGMRLLASLAFSGFGAAILPASAAPGWIGGEWKRIPIEGVASRSVGLARRRRGLPSAAERAVAEAIREVIVANAPDQYGIHPRC